ncbi:MAG TPA: hypothetical protein VJ724_12360, partial [Tahibacter sp.]|nr:hypothetical protein [Tahibacter sp.]
MSRDSFRPRLVLSCFLLAPSLMLSTHAALASVNSIQIGIASSGTVPFDADDAAGNDSSATNAFLRTRDLNGYTVTLNLNGPETGAYFILSQPAGTTPGSYTGPAIAAWQQWQRPSAGAPLASCANFQATGTVTAASTSSGWLDAAHTQLKCYVGNVPAGGYQQSFNFTGQVPVVPNGSTLPGAVVNYCSTTTVCTSGGTVSPVAQTPMQPPGGVPLNGGQLATETITARPQWDLVKGSNSVSFVSGSGPAGEDGFVYLLRFQQWATNARALGIEALNPTMTVTDDVSGINAQAQLVTWAVNNLPYECLSSIPANPAGCRGNQASGPAFDTGPVSSGALNTVPNGGSCTATQPGGPGTPLTIQLSGADFTVPRLMGSTVCTHAYSAGPVGAQATSKQIFLWIPSGAVPVGNTSITNRIVAPSTSVTGVANADPGNAATPGGATGNNLATITIVNNPSAYHTKLFSQIATGSLDNASASATSNQAVNNAMADQYATSRLIVGNNGTTTFNNIVVCDKVDNVRTTLVVPATYPGTIAAAYLPQSQGVFGYFKPGAASSVALNAAQTPAFTVEYGIGGVNGVGDTWASYNTVTSPTVNPGGASAQGTGTCADNQSAGGVWYTFADLQNDTIPGGAQAITKVRIKVTSLAPGQEFGYFVPFRVRDTYAYSGTDLAPGTTFTAGAPTSGAFVPNRSSALFPGYNGGNPLASADALQIAYASSFSGANKTVSPAGLIQPGTVLTYTLNLGFTTPGYPQAETLTYTDPLPAGMTYLPGSSRYGSSPIADPVIQADTPTAGRQTLVWTIPGVIPAHAPTATNVQALSFRAQAGFQFAQGQVVTNTASVTSSIGGAAAGPSVSSTVDAPAGLRFTKLTTTPNVEQNQPFHYTTSFSAASITPLNFELIDVLPYDADGRTPPSVVTGGYASVTVTPDPANPAPASNLLYSRNAPANIDTNPFAAGAHSKNGSGTNSAALTVWCTTAQFGSGDCPANAGQITAFLLAMHPFDAAGNPQGNTPLPTSQVYSFGIDLTPTGNAYGNVYTNQARASSSDGSLAPISSP